MAEEQVVATKRPKAEVTQVQMSDGRSVGFAGKRRLLKETLIDDSKIVVDGDTVTLQAGAVSVRMDFRNGETRTFALPIALLARFAGHGGEQKYGDELEEEDTESGRIHLTRFQTDGLFRARRILERYNGVLIADGVGLGKTFLAGEMLRDVLERHRQRALLIAPAALRDGTWERFKDSIQYAWGWASGRRSGVASHLA